MRCAGGVVYYEWRIDDAGMAFYPGKPRAPQWLVDLVGLDYLGSVVDVFSINSSVSDADMRKIGRLHRLEKLDLGSSAVTDSGMAHVENLSDLQSLQLNNTDVTDTGLAHLRP